MGPGPEKSKASRKAAIGLQQVNGFAKEWNDKGACGVGQSHLDRAAGRNRPQPKGPEEKNPAARVRQGQKSIIGKKTPPRRKAEERPKGKRNKGTGLARRRDIGGSQNLSENVKNGKRGRRSRKT